MICHAVMHFSALNAAGFDTSGCPLADAHAPVHRPTRTRLFWSKSIRFSGTAYLRNTLTIARRLLPITCFRNSFCTRSGLLESTLTDLVSGAGVIITSKSDYGLRAALHLARHPGRVRLREIALEQHIPTAVCAQVMRKLVGAQIVSSTAGPAGGYTLAREAEKISIASILAASDRDICVFRCLDDGCDCELSGRCAFQTVLQGFGREIARRLENMSLADLRDKQNTFDDLMPSIHGKGSGCRAATSTQTA